MGDELYSLPVVPSYSPSSYMLVFGNPTPSWIHQYYHLLIETPCTVFYFIINGTDQANVVNPPI